MKLKIFEVFQFKKNVNNTMAISMHNFENFIRTKIVGDAFKDILSFSKSKKLACNVFKKRAILDIISILSLRHEKVTRKYFGRYWFRIHNMKQRKNRLRAIFGKFNS
jgi:3-dehydroquinate dehydratase